MVIRQRQAPVISRRTYPSQCASIRSKLDSDPLVATFKTHCLASFIRKTPVPCGANIDASREQTDETVRASEAVSVEQS